MVNIATFFFSNFMKYADNYKPYYLNMGSDIQPKYNYIVLLFGLTVI